MYMVVMWDLSQESKVIRDFHTSDYHEAMAKANGWKRELMPTKDDILISDTYNGFYSPSMIRRVFVYNQKKGVSHTVAVHKFA